MERIGILGLERKISIQDHPLPSISVGGQYEKMSSRFIRNRTGIRRIPPLRSLSHVKRRDLTGSETAAKGAGKPAHPKSGRIMCEHLRAFVNWKFRGGLRRLSPTATSVGVTPLIFVQPSCIFTPLVCAFYRSYCITRVY